MAIIGAVLGVIRASRPTLKTAIERVAFAIHATFLAVGYAVVAVGAANDGAYDGTEEHEVGFEGWNMLEGAYAFCYSGVEQHDLCKSVTLKLVVMVDSLMIDVASIETEALHHLEIRANDFAKEGELIGSYAQQFNNLGGLIKQINDSFLAKISPSRIMAPFNSNSTSSTVLQNDHLVDTRHTPSSPLIYDTRRSISNPNYMLPPIFMGSNSDLFPRGGGGIFAARREFGSDGMLIGPSDVRWHQPNGSNQQQISDVNDLNILSNVRYDPIGPPSVLDIDDRNTNRPPERHPDLEHF